MAERREDFVYKKASGANSAILGTLEGPCADIVSGTRNGRKYSDELWTKVFNNDIVKEQLANGGIFGEAGHPTDREEVDIEKIAIAMPEAPTKKNGKLWAKFHILDTPCGRVLKTLCDYGYKIGISSRGTGDVIEDYEGNSEVDPDTYDFTCFDAVLIPAVKEARMNYVAEGLSKTRYHKTLKQKLVESLDKASDKDRKLMKEALDNLGVNLTEGKVEEEEASKNVDEAFDPRNVTKVLNAINDGIETDEDVDGLKDYLYRIMHYVQSMADDYDIDLKAYGDKLDELDEGAEGRREPGFEYVIYDDTDTDDGNSPIVAIRSTRVEAEYAAAKMAGLMHNEPGSKKYEGRRLSFERVPKGRFKVGDNFYGPFDQDWNLREAAEDSSLVVTPTDSVKLVFQDKAVMDFVVNGDDEVYSDLIQNCEEVAAEEGKDHMTFHIKYDDNVEEWYPDWESEIDECNTQVECTDRSDDVQKELKEAKDNGSDDLLEQLQASLTENAQLKKQLQELQSKVAVSDTEVNKVNEALAHYKSATVVLSAKAKEAKTLEKKVSTLTEKLKTTERDHKATVAQKLQEGTQTSRKLAKLTESVKQKTAEVEQLTEELEETKANAELKRSEYNKTITKAKTLIKEYKALANNTMNRYIESKATMLGVSANEIKNRLDESYSVDDVDKVCESLQSYQVNISRLPFNVNSKVRVTESKKEALQVMSPFDDDIDEDLLALAKMHF